MSGSRWFGVDLDLVRRRTGLGLATAAIAVAAALVGLGFTARAGEIVLARHVEPEFAALIVAGVAMVVALFAVIATIAVARRTRNDVSRAVATSAIVAAAPTAASIALRHSRLAGVVAAAGVGFWLARRAR